MPKKLYSDNLMGDANIALKSVEKRLDEFQKSLPADVQKTFNRVHDSVIKTLLSSYFSSLASNSPKVIQDLIIVIITCTHNMIQNTKSETTKIKLRTIHQHALTLLEHELHIEKHLQPQQPNTVLFVD